MSAVGAPGRVALEADRATPAGARPVGMWWRQLLRLKWGVAAAIVPESWSAPSCVESSLPNWNAIALTSRPPPKAAA